VATGVLVFDFEFFIGDRWPLHVGRIYKSGLSVDYTYSKYEIARAYEAHDLSMKTGGLGEKRGPFWGQKHDFVTV